MALGCSSGFPQCNRATMILQQKLCYVNIPWISSAPALYHGAIFRVTAYYLFLIKTNETAFFSNQICPLPSACATSWDQSKMRTRCSHPVSSSNWTHSCPSTRAMTSWGGWKLPGQLYSQSSI